MQLASHAQAQGITLHYKAAPLETVINSISKQTRYNFFYDADFLKKANPVTIDVDNSNIGRVLNLVFADQPFSYQLNDKSILLKDKTKAKEDAAPAVDKIVHGMVLDSAGLPIPGASINIKGTSVVTQTDNSGHFYLRSASDNPVVIVKYMGYETQEVKPKGDIAINVVLSTNAVSLDDVVVTGYQTTTKGNSTGSIAKVDNEKLNKFINTDLTAALEGKVAGLSMYKGDPILRGTSTFQTITVGNMPLVVIDGLPTETALNDINPYDVESVTVLKDAAAASIYGARAANGVIIVTTKKGVKGKTQVTFNTDFFITEKPDLDNMHYASSSQLVDYESARYQAELLNKGNAANVFADYGGIGAGTVKYYSPVYALYRQQAEGKINADQLASSLSGLGNNDYYSQFIDQAWQNESRQRYNLSLSSASDKSNTYFSFNYDKTNERVRNNNGERFNMYFKSTYQLSDHLTATVGLNGRYNRSTSTNSVYDNYTLQQRYAAISDAGGNRILTDYVGNIQGFTSLNSSVADALAGNTNFKSFKFNVLDELERDFTKSNALNVRAFANLDYKIIGGLKYSIQGQYEINKADVTSYSEADSYAMRNLYNTFTSYAADTKLYKHYIPDGDRQFQSSQQKYSYTFRNQLDYSKSFGIGKTKHDFSALAGFEMRQTFTPVAVQDTRYGYNPITLGSQLLDLDMLKRTGITSYPFNNVTTLSSSDGQLETKHRYVSMYGNMSYTVNDRYNLTGSIRVDQADLFGSEIRSQFRPIWSVGGGWNASNEDFLSDLRWLNYLKVRATYGIGGNIDQSTTSEFTARVANDRLYPSLTYLNLGALPNPKLRWEKTATANFGIDYAVFNNRIHGSIDVYRKISTDLLITMDLEPTLGASTQIINNGSLSNKGVEFTVGSDWFKHGDWTLSSNFVFAYNRTKVLDVARASTTGSNYVNAPTNYFFTNQNFNSLYVYKYAGLTNGYPVFLDENGNPNVTFDANGVPTTIKALNSPLAFQNAGSLTPTYNGSFQQSIRYKSFELGAMFIFYGGNKLRKDVLDFSTNYPTDVDLANRWTSSNPDSNIPRALFDYPLALQSNGASTLYSLYRSADINVASASFVRLRNISFSYAVPKTFLKKVNLQQVKFTAQANNPFLWAAAGDDIDPETYSLNSGTRSLSTPRSFLFGLAVTF